MARKRKDGAFRPRPGGKGTRVRSGDAVRGGRAVTGGAGVEGSRAGDGGAAANVAAMLCSNAVIVVDRGAGNLLRMGDLVCMSHRSVITRSEERRLIWRRRAASARAGLSDGKRGQGDDGGDERE